MRFSDELEEAMRDKWRAYYINYVGLRQKIEDLEADPTASNTEFMKQLQMQMVKVMTFYDNAEERLRTSLGAAARLQVNVKEILPKRHKALLQEADMLKQYAKLNVEGLRKIAKKYDKRCRKAVKNETLCNGNEEPTPLQVGIADAKPDSPETGSLQADLLDTLSGSRIIAAQLRIDAMLEALDSDARSDLSQPLLATPAISERRSIARSKSGYGIAWIFEKHETPRPQVHGSPGSDSPRSIPSDLIGMLLQQSPSDWRLIGKPPSVEVVAPVIFTVLCVAMYYGEVCPELEWEAYFTVFVTLESLFLLIQQNAPDVVLLFATLVLTLAGVITDAEAWAGFSNNVVLSVGVLGIVSAGIKHTGVVSYIFLRILGKPGNYPKALLQLCLPSFILNSCVSNTCVMGVLIPVIETWTNDINMHPALFLMPFSYLMLISGTIVIFSTSSNLITQGLLVARSYPPFGNFEISSLSALCTFVTLVYMMIAVPVLLRQFRSQKAKHEGDELSEDSKAVNSANAQVKDMKLYVASIQISGVIKKEATMGTSGLLELLPGGIKDIVRLERMAEEVTPVSDDSALQQYDVLSIWTQSSAIVELRQVPWITFIALDAGCEQLHSKDNRALVEVVLDGLCPLVKEPLSSTRRLEKLYSASCLAVRPCHMQHFRQSETQAEEAKALVRALRHPKEERAYHFKVGDNLLLDVSHNFDEEYADSPHFTSLRKFDMHEKEEDTDGDEDSATSKRNMVISMILLVCMVTLVATDTLSLLQASMLTVFGLVATGCLPRQNAFNAINVRTILTIVGAFGIGKAIGKTGVAKMLALGLCHIMAPFGSLGLFVAIFAATVGLGVVFHATAVVILMFPICEEVAFHQDIPLHQACAVLMMGAGCQMLSPVSYQTNLMAFNCGHYTFADFPKVGAGAVVLIGITSVLSVESLIEPEKYVFAH